MLFRDQRVAVPVAAPEICEEFRGFVDEIVCAETPEPFLTVGYWYEDFRQTEDEEVRRLLEQARGDESLSARTAHAEPAASATMRR